MYIVLSENLDISKHETNIKVKAQSNIDDLR
jgi:hypothetical protein